MSAQRRAASNPVVYAARAAGAVMRHPAEGIERVCERLAERRDLRTPLPSYGETHDWEAQLHRRLGAPWPCPDSLSFSVVWSEVLAAVRARGLSVGLGAFGGWDDGDSAFARAAWCLVAHLEPGRVVETGVARGLTTRCILEGLLRNGRGHLWSIDIAPLIERSLGGETGVAIDERCLTAWTFVRGSSRRRLPAVLAKSGPIELFVHDSMHTGWNVAFELRHALRSLVTSGWVLIDDIDQNRYFDALIRLGGNGLHLVAPHEDRRGYFGITGGER
jgi:hypothetical protein